MESLLLDQMQSPPSVAAPVATKLRSSCNACGEAKVKCDRGHPECRRCTASGLVCVYAPSRNCGKPPRHSKRPAEHSSYLPDERPAEKRIRNSSSRPESARGASRLRQIQGAPGDNVSLPRPYGYVDHSTSDDSASLSMLATPQPLPVTGCPAEPPSMFGSMDLGSLDFFSAFPLDPGGLSMGAVNPFVSTASRITSSEDSPASAAASSPLGSHSCPRESYEIFRDLICPTPALHAPMASGATVAAQLDEVLQFTSQAIHRLRRLLQCPCARSGHRAMVHASIVSRILVWYQQAAAPSGRPDARTETAARQTPRRSSCSSDASSSDEDWPADSSGVPTGFVVEAQPISVGTFTLEDQDMQAIVRSQLVLSELKKMGPLIDVFMAQGGHGQSHTTGLYYHLGTWLRREQTGLMNMLRSRLRKLNEALET